MDMVEKTEETTSREERKNRRKLLKQEKADVRQNITSVRRIRIRLIPIWARVLIVLLLIVLCVMTGLMVGYGVIGEGNPTDVLKWETWQHVIDLVNAP
ncbi:DNA-directed RNA polymerase subunit beta [Bacillus oleivorans]|uniref:DNA-directed RNA polymerase subunit beta n=1 Tax=Bacillus oleivorans TaxID=1448271 RepID=A0A285CI54_9BACI|nr:DNA-directed RNA polymerase subunit beta [Bacillus oleivorans]SNX67025.1 DNA-directed RNA polymerase subunit beta [Bacillus oleivorans]